MSNNKIKNIQDTIKQARERQITIVKDIEEGIMPEKHISSFTVWAEYESIIVNLQTQQSVMESIKDTDRITMLAYRVALISLGASGISILASLIIGSA